MTAAYATHDEVFAAVERVEPCTVMEAMDALGIREWSQRTTIRNRLNDLVDSGALIVDEGRPARYAVNQL